MNSPFSRLIESKGFGAIYFDGHLNVVERNGAASLMLEQINAPQHEEDLQIIFPELVGIEDLLEQIITKKETIYRLDHINRINEKKDTRYWDLLIMACPEADRGMVVMEDVTEKANAIQVVNQHRYNQYLYRQSIDHRKTQIGTWVKGDSAAIKRVIDIIHQVSNIPSATVLLMGETGTGKNLTARMIHDSSMPGESPFVEINCAALPEQLVEAELFGYEKGSFTHAVSAKPGLLEEAHGGTLFLDEIGELQMNMQAKLLSVMESKRFRRLGSTKTIEVDVRIIAATNRDLQSDVASKKFREDLYYRLNVVSMTLPPLRELGRDVVLIAEHFIELLNVEFNKRVKGLAAGACDALLAHSWPGNVRELSNCIERAMIFIDRDVIDVTDLVLFTPASDGNSSVEGLWQVPPAGINLEDVEKQLILSALERAKNNKSLAARLLGLTRHTLRYRLEKYDLA